MQNKHTMLLCFIVIFHLYILNVTLLLSHERLDNFGIFIYIQGSIDSGVKVELV